MRQKPKLREPSRPQVTAYLSHTTRKWLDGYAKKFGLEKSETVRILIEREKRIRWLEAAFNLPLTDPPAKPLRSKAGLARGGNKPLKSDTI
jgi:hypothetical protein